MLFGILIKTRLIVQLQPHTTRQRPFPWKQSWPSVSDWLPRALPVNSVTCWGWTFKGNWLVLMWYGFHPRVIQRDLPWKPFMNVYSQNSYLAQYMFSEQLFIYEQPSSRDLAWFAVIRLFAWLILICSAAIKPFWWFSWTKLDVWAMSMESMPDDMLMGVTGVHIIFNKPCILYVLIQWYVDSS